MTRSPSSSRSGCAGRQRKKFLDSVFGVEDRGIVRCWICLLPIASRSEASVDHVIEVSVGGDEHPENYQPAHRACNNWRSNPRKSELK